MSVGLIIERPGTRISIDEWTALVQRDELLRLRTEPYAARNPATGAVIQIPIGDADAEYFVDGDWLPFLRFKRGSLQTEYLDEFEDPKDPFRTKIAQIAKLLGAVIATDADDETLDW